MWGARAAGPPAAREALDARDPRRPHAGAGALLGAGALGPRALRAGDERAAPGALRGEAGGAARGAGAARRPPPPADRPRRGAGGGGGGGPPGGGGGAGVRAA